MAKTKSRRNRGKKSLFKTIRTSTSKAIPAVASGLKNIGRGVKNITMKSKPTIEKGLGDIYGSVLSGFNLGVKGVKKGINLIKHKKTSHRKYRK
jgi:hypothetical protein